MVEESREKQREKGAMELTSEHYCKVLGHHVPFSYCLNAPDRQAQQRICRHIRNCWFERFDIDTYLETNFGKAVIDRIGGTGEPKLTSLVELIARAKSTGKNQGSS